MRQAERKAYYEMTAKRLAASTYLYGVDAVVHVEDKDDIQFWQRVLSRYSTRRYKFLPATINEWGHRSTGCTQCLKYRDFLSQRFFICIDSDLRYLLGEELLAEKGILQTYTYSWENHYAFAPRLQQAFDSHISGRSQFDFTRFLLRYSQIVYRPFIYMLYHERMKLEGFTRDKFRHCITLQYRRGDEQGDGAPFLDRLTENLALATEGLASYWEEDGKTDAVRYAVLGLREDNAYLYVRGHCLYNSLVSIGKKLCERTGVSFERNILREALEFEGYEEMGKIGRDVREMEKGSLRGL